MPPVKHRLTEEEPARKSPNPKHGRPRADSPRTENRALGTAGGHSAEPDGLDSSQPVRRALPLPPQRERTWTPFPELGYESLVSKNDAAGGSQSRRRSSSCFARCIAVKP